MASYNKLILIGNLTRDPELRYIQSGSAVCQFTIAVNYKRDDPPMFIRCTAWERLAETCNTYLSKGKPVLVEGRLAVREYDDKDGVKRTSVECNVNSMQMLGSRDENAPRASGGAMPTGVTDEDLDDEIPF